MKAIDALDVYRTLCQLSLKKNINILSDNKEIKYYSNSIVSLGQFHTLHNLDGKAACEMIWYEPRYIESNAKEIKPLEFVEANISKWLKCINKSTFKQHIISVAVAYINALDHSNHEFRFMKLWSVLEKIVISDSSTIIKKRVSFIYSDRAIHSEMIESLREARNVNAHSGTKPFNVELKNYQMCSYIEDLLKFFVYNPFNYKKLNSLLEFISLTTTLETVNEQILNLKKVKKFINAS